MNDKFRIKNLWGLFCPIREPLKDEELWRESNNFGAAFDIYRDRNNLIYWA